MYKFYRDPGHAWLEVPLVELAQLNIVDKVTAYSYVNYGLACAYLEEDCDLSLYREVKGFDAAWWSEHVEVIDLRNAEVHHRVGNGLPGRQWGPPRHIVRDLPMYEVPSVVSFIDTNHGGRW